MYRAFTKGDALTAQRRGTRPHPPDTDSAWCRLRAWQQAMSRSERSTLAGIGLAALASLTFVLFFAFQMASLYCPSFAQHGALVVAWLH